MAANPAYDDRYLAGILFFNGHDFFEAHEVWEAIWMDAGADKRFYQGLIQAAVALYHFGNGNLAGASKLFKSARDYMGKYTSPYLGLDHVRFWQQMEVCFHEMLSTEKPDRHTIKLDEAKIPEITIDPQPAIWPDPQKFVEAEENDEQGSG